MSKYDITQIKGVIPAMLTVFKENEEVDVNGLKILTDYLINKEVDALYLTGSTGESFMMDINERELVSETVINQVDGRIPVIVHVGDIGTKKSIKLAKHAYEIGADALSSVPPFYWDFTEDEIYSFYNDLAGSTPLPFIIYNIARAGIMSLDLIKRLYNIPNVKGIKYTAATHYEIVQMKQELGEDFIIYSGSDQMALSGLISGADGLIGSSYNWIPGAFNMLYSAYMADDFITARSIQNQVTKIIMYSTCGCSYMPVIRMGLKWMGIDAGYSRKPVESVTKEKEQEMMKWFTDADAEQNLNYIDFIKFIK